MKPRRLARLNEFLTQQIARMVASLKDPNIGFVTISGVELTADFSLARIFFSVLGTVEERAKTAQALERSIPVLRGRIGKLENIRRAPSLKFIYDSTPEQATRVLELLEQLDRDKREKSGGDEDAQKKFSQNLEGH